MQKMHRKDKKRLFVWLNAQLYDAIKARADIRNIDITQWILIAVADLMEKENKYQ